LIERRQDEEGRRKERIFYKELIRGDYNKGADFEKLGMLGRKFPGILKIKEKKDVPSVIRKICLLALLTATSHFPPRPFHGHSWSDPPPFPHTFERPASSWLV